MSSLTTAAVPIGICKLMRLPSESSGARLGRTRAFELGEHTRSRTFELVVVGHCGGNAVETLAQSESTVLI